MTMLHFLRKCAASGRARASWAFGQFGIGAADASGVVCAGGSLDALNQVDDVRLGSASVVRRRLLYVVPEDWAFVVHFIALARAARAAGYEVMVATKVTQHRAAIEREGFDVLEMHGNRGSRSLASLFHSVVRLREILDSAQPEIVHALGLHSVVLMGLSRLTRRDCPLVASFTGLGFLWSGQSLIGWFGRPLIRLLARLVARSPDVAATFENQDDCFEFPGIRNPVVIGGWGMESPSLPKPSRSDDVVRIAYLGRMIKAKGIADTIEAVRIARQRDPRIVLELWGSPDLRNPTSLSLAELRDLTGLDGVTWMGEAPTVQDVWSRADIAILLSEREGLPRALIEAASYALPMIATDVPGCRSIVRSGIDGFLVPRGDVMKAAEAILFLAQDPVNRDRMGQKARQQFDDRFSTTKVLPKLIEIYGRLTGNRTISHRKADFPHYG